MSLTTRKILSAFFGIAAFGIMVAVAVVDPFGLGVPFVGALAAQQPANADHG